MNLQQDWKPAAVGIGQIDGATFRSFAAEPVAFAATFGVTWNSSGGRIAVALADAAAAAALTVDDYCPAAAAVGAS
jgi:hypothetical protein